MGADRGAENENVDFAEFLDGKLDKRFVLRVDVGVCGFVLYLAGGQPAEPALLGDLAQRLLVATGKHEVGSLGSV